MAIREQLKIIASGQYARSLVVLTSGTIIAQLVPIIFYPIIARLFNPEDFGFLATLTAIAATVGSVASGQYFLMILISRSKQAAINIGALTICLSFIILLFLMSVAYLFSDVISGLLKEDRIGSYLFVPFISAFFIIIYQCYNEWCVKNKYFKNLTINKITNSSSVPLSQLLFGLTNLFSGIGLIFGDLLGRFISAGSCLLGFWRKDRAMLKYISISRMKLYALRYIDCPKYIMPGQLLNTIGGSIPIFAIGAFFSQEDVGFFSMANLVIILPSTIIGRAVSDIFRQKASEIYNMTGNCRDLYIKNFIPLFAISVIVFSILYIISQWLFLFVLGEEWIEAGVFAKILIPMAALSFISGVFGVMGIVAEKLKYAFYWQIFYIIMMIIPFIFAIWIEDIYIILKIFSTCMSLAYIGQLILSYRFTKKNKI